MISPDVTDTIVAIASAPGEGLRGIVRVSGSETLSLLHKLFNSDFPLDQNQNCTRQATFKLNEQVDGQLLPGRLLVWPTNRSYTRQPTAEFHTLGSRPLLDLVVQQFCEAGARLAQPGEFTLRAFLSGRIDLTQAEAVLAVIDSEGEQQLDRALTQLAGGLAGPLTDLQNQLVDLLAELEAGLDFVEEDIEFVTTQQIIEQLHDAKQSLLGLNEKLKSRADSGQLPTIAIVGLPNAGKSSLFNSLLGRQQAIVSSEKGTTRDFVAARVQFSNQQANLLDTAGVDASNVQSEIDAIAQSQARSRTIDATIRLLCLDATQSLELSKEFVPVLEPKRDLVVITKLDQISDQENKVNLLEQLICNIGECGFSNAILVTSAKTGEGLEALIAKLEHLLQHLDVSDSPIVHTTALRTAGSLIRAQENIEQALLAAEDSLGPELVASEIRQSLEQLAEVVGKVYTDDILDRIFSRFCIGK